MTDPTQTPATEIERIAGDLAMIADDFLEPLADKLQDPDLTGAAVEARRLAGHVLRLREKYAAKRKVRARDLRPGDRFRDPDGYAATAEEIGVIPAEPAQVRVFGAYPEDPDCTGSWWAWEPDEEVELLVKEDC